MRLKQYIGINAIDQMIHLRIKLAAVVVDSNGLRLSADSLANHESVSR
jgi:hypothetical protein